MKQLTCVALAALSLTLAGGCSTVVVNRASGTAAVGKTYTKAIKDVNTLAITQSLEFAAQEAASDDNRDVNTLGNFVTAQRERIKEVQEASDYLSKLSDYFDALEALTKGDNSTQVGEQVAKIATSLASAPSKIEIPADRKAALSNIASLVAKQVHADAVRRTLERDANTVALAIEVSNQMLNEVSKWVERNDKRESDRIFREQVELPYRTKQPLGADWQAKFVIHVRGSPTQEVLKKARKASVEMQVAWRDVLNGNYSFAEIIAALEELRAGLDAINAVKKST